MKVAIYIRTSTDDQNPENQLRDCLSINKYGEYELIEDKVSGWKELNREGFDRLKKLVIHNKIEHIIVWDLDRLFRNRKNLISFFSLCQVKKVNIHSFRQEWLEQINTIPSPFNEIMHNLMLQIMGWIAEEESNKKSERVRAAQRVKDGVTYSYKGNKWGRKEISTVAIRKILELRNKGKNIREICKEVTWDNGKNVSMGVVHKIISGNHRKIKKEEENSQLVNL